MAQRVITFDYVPGLTRSYTTIPNTFAHIEMWGGKGGHAFPEKKSKSGYISFWFSTNIPLQLDFDLGGGGLRGLGGFNGGGNPGGPLAYGGGGATTCTFTVLGHTKTIAIAAGGGGASATGDLGADAGYPGGRAGFSYQGTAGNSATATTNGGYPTEHPPTPAWDSVLPSFKQGGSGWKHIETLSFTTSSDTNPYYGMGGGGGAGGKSGSGGSTKVTRNPDGSSHTYTISGSGGGGAGCNFWLQLPPNFDPTKFYDYPDLWNIGNFTVTATVDGFPITLTNAIYREKIGASTRGSGLSTTHPLYIPFNPRFDGSNGYVRITENVPLPPGIEYASTTSGRQSGKVGQSIPLPSTATVVPISTAIPETVPLSYEIDGISYPTTQFVKATVDLPVGEHSIVATSESDNFFYRNEYAYNIIDLDIILSSPERVTIGLSGTTLITGGILLAGANGLDFTLQYQIDQNPFVNLTSQLDVNNNFSLTYNAPLTPATETIRIQLVVDGIWVVEKSVTIVTTDDLTKAQLFITPPQYSEFIRTDLVAFDARCIASDNSDQSSGMQYKLPNDASFTLAGSSNFSIKFSDHGIVAPSQVMLSLQCQDLTQNQLVTKDFPFYVYDASIDFIGMQSAYSPDLFTEIIVDTNASIDYASSHLTTGSLAKNLVHLYLDNDPQPFATNGTGTLSPLPEAGEHTITARIYKRDVTGDTGILPTLFLIERTFVFTIQESRLPVITIEATLARALIESYQVTAVAFNWDQTQTISNNVIWDVDGNSAGNGSSVLLDMLQLGSNLVRATITDPDNQLTTEVTLELVANAVVDCLTGENLVELATGGQARLADLESGMLLLDYLDNPVQIVALEKLSSESQRFVKISIPGAEKSLLITGEHPILYQNQAIPARLLVGQPHVDIHITEQPRALYHIITEKKTFVKIAGCYVCTKGFDETFSSQ